MKAYVVAPPAKQQQEAKKLPPKAEKPVVERSGKYGPTIALNPSSKWPFRFGPSKARLILLHLEAIKQFAADFPAQDGEE